MIVTHYIGIEPETPYLEYLGSNEDQADRNADLYSAGELDAVIGAEPDPQWWSNGAYRRGYLDSFCRFYDRKYGSEQITEF